MIETAKVPGESELMCRTEAKRGAKRDAGRRGEEVAIM